MMMKSEVKIGGVYIAKVTNKLVQVRIDAVSRYGGWDGTNLSTSKKVRIRSATKLRSAVGGAPAQKHNNKKPKTPPEAQPASAVENVADVKPVPGICSNGGSTERDEDGDCAKCHEPKQPHNAKNASDAKTPRSRKAGAEKPKRLSGLDAAVKVMEDTGVPMNVKEIVEVAFAKGYWKPAGRTPSATLAAALIREIAKKGSQSRFRKSERGKFMLNRQ
jgi:hypothetical protein